MKIERKMWQMVQPHYPFWKHVARNLYSANIELCIGPTTKCLMSGTFRTWNQKDMYAESSVSATEGM